MSQRWSVTELPREEDGTLSLWHLCFAEQDAGGRFRAELRGAERRVRSRPPAVAFSILPCARASVSLNEWQAGI